jgi:hypothetical protein
LIKDTLVIVVTNGKGKKFRYKEAIAEVKCWFEKLKFSN